MWLPNSLWTWAFLSYVLLQSAVVIILQAYSFADFENNLTNASSDKGPNATFQTIPGVNPPKRYVFTKTIPTFLTLYLFAVVYQIVLTVDALRLKNTIQVIGLCFFNLLLMVYGAGQVKQISDALQELQVTLKNTDLEHDTLFPLSVATAVVFAFGVLVLSFIAWKLYHEFAWTIYKHISADLRMKRRYLTYQVYIALLKFDFFFFLGYSIQFLVIVQSAYPGDPEFGLTVAALPITIIILLLAAFFTRREMMVGMVFINLVYVAGMAYFIFKLVRIWYGTEEFYYQAAAKTLTIFAVIAIILLIATLATSIKCTMNFNKGLMPHIQRRKPESEEEKAYVTEMPNLHHTGAPMPSRMTIE